jgi:hypothetical protein
MASPNPSHADEFFGKEMQRSNPLNPYYQQNHNPLHPYYQQIPLQQYYPS